MAIRYDVFLSYNSADVLSVEKLARKLRQKKLHPFFDKWALIPGEPIQEALEKALDESRACAVFLGPSGFGKWHNEEMRSALQTRVGDSHFRVIPIFFPGFPDSEREKLPRFLKLLKAVDFSGGLDDKEALRLLVLGIRESSDQQQGSRKDDFVPRGEISPYRFVGVQPREEKFIHRGMYEEIVEALCQKAGAINVPYSIGHVVALWGVGGFGKTSLAQAICFDGQVRRRYSSGILWRTMGENLSEEGRCSRIMDLVRSWTLLEPPAFKGPEAAGEYLRDKLRGQRVLIVLDDVWSSADVIPFLGLGSGSAVLITTLNSQALPAHSVQIEVDAMNPPEAVSLLSSGLPDRSANTFEALADRLGAWPLLLKLVNGQLRNLVNQDGSTIPNAIREVEMALDLLGFSAFDRNEESRHSAASRTIFVSARYLSERERTLYFQLAIFPGIMRIPLAVVAEYWRENPFVARNYCRRFRSLSLLREFRDEMIILHDVIRRVLAEQIKEELPLLHVRFLDAFRPPSGWIDLEKENRYLWSSLAYHLHEANLRNELREMLLDFYFLKEKLKNTDIAALISDYTVLAGEDHEFRLIQDALWLSAEVLAGDVDQLAPQLLGRLQSLGGESIQKLVAGADSFREKTWLRPRTANLTQPSGQLIRVLEGHEGGVLSVVALDNHRVISASEDRTLKVWDLESGRTLQTLRGHTAEVFAVAVFENQQVVSASKDGTLRLWDLENWRCLRILKDHAVGALVVAMLPAGRVVSSSSDGTMRLWSLKSGQTLQTLKGHSAGILCIALWGDQCLVSASKDATLRVWDLESGQALQVLEGHRGEVLSVAVEGDRAISASEDRTLRVWDLQSGGTLQILKGHGDWVRAVAVMDARHIVSASDERTLRVWDLENGRTLQILEGHSNWIRSIAMLKGGRAISASDDRTLRVWDLKRARSVLPPDEHGGEIKAVAMISDSHVISASADGTLRVWDVDSGRTFHKLEGHRDGVNAVAVVDARRIISASDDTTLKIWDLESGQVLQTLEGHTGLVHSVTMVDDRRAVSASNDKTLRVWDLESGRTLQTLEGHDGGVNAVTAVEGRLAVSASNDGTLKVWDLESGQTFRALKGHTNLVLAVSIVDDRRIVSASYDRTLRIWDLETGETLQILEGHKDGVTAVAVNGLRAISASADKTLRIWNLEAGATLSVMTLEAPLTAVAVSPNGQIIVAGDRGDQSGRLHFFDLVEPE